MLRQAFVQERRVMLLLDTICMLNTSGLAITHSYYARAKRFLFSIQQPQSRRMMKIQKESLLQSCARRMLEKKRFFCRFRNQSLSPATYNSKYKTQMGPCSHTCFAACPALLAAARTSGGGAGVIAARRCTATSAAPVPPL